MDFTYGDFKTSIDVTSAEFQKKFEELMKKYDEEWNATVKMYPPSVQYKAQTQAFVNVFVGIFGEENTKKILGESPSIRDCVEAYKAFIVYRQKYLDATSDVFEEVLEVVGLAEKKTKKQK